MAQKSADRVQEVSTAAFAGTGAVLLGGVPSSPVGRVTFAAGIGDTHSCTFLIDDNAGNWEISEGTLTVGAPDQLSRDQVIANSAGDLNPINFTAGVKDVKLVASAKRVVHINVSGELIDGDGNQLSAGFEAGFCAFGLNSTAPTGWMKYVDGSVGNASSNATARANADASALFEVLWTSFDNTAAPIEDSAGAPSTRGASAADDFAANKRMPFPADFAARALVVAGTSTSLTDRAAGDEWGAEQVTLNASQMPSHNHSYNVSQAASNIIAPGGSNAHNHTAGSVTGPAGGDGAHENQGPRAALNMFVKL